MFPFLLCCAGFRFLVLCFITSILCCLVRLFFVLGCLPRWFVMRCLVFFQERIGALDAGFCLRIFQRRVVYLVSILMFLRCFLLVFSCFLKFICNGFLEKRMSDEGFWIYVFCMGNRIFLKHFLRGLFGVLRQTRRNLGDFGRVFNPLYIGFRI